MPALNRRAMRALNDSHWRDPQTYCAELSASRAWLAALRKKYQDASVIAPYRVGFCYDPRYWRTYRVRTGRSPWRPSRRATVGSLSAGTPSASPMSGL